MRTILSSLFASVAFAAETETGSASTPEAGTSLLPETSPATGKRILPDISDAMQAAIKADGEKRAKAAKPADKPAKAAKPGKAKAAKPDETDTRFGSLGTYREKHNGASPTFRGHTRKLSPIVLNRICGTFTDRDADFMHDIYTRFGDKQFRLPTDADAGNTSRAIGHSYLAYVSGPLDRSGPLIMRVTAKYVKRVTPVTAKPAKAAKAAQSA